jgi:hypothetical protein
MDSVLEALAHEERRRIVRELRRAPGQRHADLLAPLGLTRSKGQLTKLIAPLEASGVVARTDGQYYVVNSDAIGRLLSAAADVNVSAQRVLAERARVAVKNAERVADELRDERRN